MQAPVPEVPHADRRPLLVTGMPRSGTTWLARLCATAAATAMPGREPMNPRGGYALHHTVSGWVALDRLTPLQRRALNASFHGLNPFTLGRYGVNQLSAVRPSVRVVIKDPYAMLSIAAIAGATGAVPLLLYRHPGAGLVSYRRMGWRPALHELRPIMEKHRATHAAARLPDPPCGEGIDEAAAMAFFWSILYGVALDRASSTTTTVVVSHEELAGGGTRATESLFTALGLNPTQRTFDHLAGDGARRPSVGKTPGDRVLHDFNRPSQQVAHSWRAAISESELELIERIAAPTLQRLENARLDLSS